MWGPALGTVEDQSALTWVGALGSPSPDREGSGFYGRARGTAWLRALALSPLTFITPASRSLSCQAAQPQVTDPLPAPALCGFPFSHPPTSLGWELQVGRHPVTCWLCSLGK